MSSVYFSVQTGPVGALLLNVGGPLLQSHGLEPSNSAVESGRVLGEWSSPDQAKQCRVTVPLSVEPLILSFELLMVTFELFEEMGLPFRK